MTMTRNEFLRSVIGVGIGATAAAALVGCGGDDGGSAGDDAPTECTSPETSIASNHGHMVTVTLADVEAGAEKTYMLSTGNGHQHELTISATQFGQIMNGQTLNLTTGTGNGHTHSVTVMCVS